MRTSSHQPAPRPWLAAAAVRVTRWMAGLIAECNEAQRRLTALRMAPDMYITDSDRAPDTYAEFLFRTSGWLRHEPSARGRGRAGC